MKEKCRGVGRFGVEPFVGGSVLLRGHDADGAEAREGPRGGTRPPSLLVHQRVQACVHYDVAGQAFADSSVTIRSPGPRESRAHAQAQAQEHRRFELWDDVQPWTLGSDGFKLWDRILARVNKEADSSS